MSLQDEGTQPTVIKKPLDWDGLNLSEAVKSVRFFKDKEGCIWGFPVFLVDPRSPGNTIGTAGSVLIRDPTNTTNIANVMAGNTDFLPLDSLLTLSQNYVYHTVLGVWEKQRTPTIFKRVEAQTNDSDIWEPAAGKKFRLLGGYIQISKEAACAGAFTIRLLDGAGGNAFIPFTISSAALVATGQVIYLPFTIPGNGFLSAAADNHLQIDCSAALTAGNYSAAVWGTEE